MKIETRIDTITPSLAASYLKRNTVNFRRLDSNRVKAYAKDMAEQKWELNGESIVFDSAGLLRDGQHRLAAVIEANVPIKMLVVWGVHATTFDRGVARTIAQTLLQSGIKNSTTIAAEARLVLMYEKGLWGRRVTTKYDIRDSEIIDFVNQNEEPLQKSILLGNKLKGMISVSLSSAVFFIGSGNKDPHPLCEWFSDRLSDGVGLGEDQPVLHLRNRLLSNKSSNVEKLDHHMLRWLFTIAWNRTVLGQPMKLLRLSLSGPAAQSPPTQILVAKENQ